MIEDGEQFFSVGPGPGFVAFIGDAGWVSVGARIRMDVNGVFKFFRAERVDASPDGAKCQVYAVEARDQD